MEKYINNLNILINMNKINKKEENQMNTEIKTISKDVIKQVIIKVILSFIGR